MADKISFQQKLADIVKLAEAQDMRLTAEEAEKFFENDGLTDQQMELVFDYLLSQKVSVTGYERKPGQVREPEQEQKKETGPEELDQEEQTYIEQYLCQIGEMKAADPQEARLAYYLPLVVQEAVNMHRHEVFAGDMIQEGNAALVEALAESFPEDTEEEQIMSRVKAAMEALLESQIEMKTRDKKMVDRVAGLDETIRKMTDELGRKVDVQEVAGRLEITEDEVRDILKLAGEEPGDDA